MPGRVVKEISFPFGGVNRSAKYAQQRDPYTTLLGINMRGEGPLESRRRGGNRPGLINVSNVDFGNIKAVTLFSYVDDDGDRQYRLAVVADGSFQVLEGSNVNTVDPVLITELGEPILLDDGSQITFSSSLSGLGSIGPSNAYCLWAHGEKVYIADDSPKAYEAKTGIIYDVPNAPSGEPLLCVYRERLFLTGSGATWYASRQDDFSDWDFNGDMNDVGRATAGRLPGKVLAMIPHEDKALILGEANSLWMMSGDPVTGNLVQVTPETGVIAPYAWCKTPEGVLAFLSKDGVYLWPIGSSDAPVPFSSKRVPESLKDINPDEYTISMAYDHRRKGVHLSLTPDTGLGEHWFFDIENAAIWQDVFQEVHQPVFATRCETGGLVEVVLACQDGYLRKFYPGSAGDDGEPIESHLLLGPIQTSNSVHDGLLAELHSSIADGASDVTWRVVVGESAEVACDKAVAAVAEYMTDGTLSDVSVSGSWSANRNVVERTRLRTPWFVIWLSCSGRWAYGAISVVTQKLGRFRP